MKKEWLASAQKAPIFDGIPPDSLRSMLDCVRPRVREVNAGTVLVQAGEPVAGMGIVLAGAVAVQKLRPSGDLVRMGTFGPGETFGEIVVFADDGRWPAMVTAAADCAIMLLPGQKILGFCTQRCEAHQRLVLNLLRSLSNRALMLNRRLDYLAAKNLRAKVAMYILEQDEMTRQRDAERGSPRPEPGNRGTRLVFLPLSRLELAEFLNVPRPSLSRELRLMKEDGLIDYYRNTVRIVDLEGLRRAVER